jgi:predicted MPP superfamily phosphohydrolase
MLRDFIRTVLFERFPLVAGVCVGLGQAVLVAWALLLVGGPEALSGPRLGGAAVAAVALNAWAVPAVGLARPRHRAGRILGPLYLGAAFASAMLAAAGLLVLGLGAGAALLLAAAGLRGPEGIALLRAASGVVVLVSAAFLAWGFAVEPRRVAVTRSILRVRGLHGSQRGLRVAHLSDLHIGNGLEGAVLDDLVARVNALAPDLVAITGDLFDHDPSALASGARALAKLRAPLGVYAVLGNHDLYTGAEDVVGALRAASPHLRTLRGECVRLATQAPLYVAGLDDPGHDWTRRGLELPALAALAAETPGDGPVILLVHRPEAFPQAAAAGFSLVLAGHFHGGQIALPGFGQRWNAARALTAFPQGRFERDGATLYVSRGLGVAGPRIRLASRPEIALLELAPSEEDAVVPAA